MANDPKPVRIEAKDQVAIVTTDHSPINAVSQESRQAAALRHVVLAEQEAGDVPGLSHEVRPPKIETAAVVGAGAMGAGIAMCFANAGMPVTLLDVSQENVDRGLATIRKNYESSLAKGRVTAAEAGACIGLISGATDYAAAGGADLVIEAVFEDLGVKKDVFKKLDAACKAEAILATNTSYLDINALADSTRRPDKVVGLHFFNPAHIMNLLEIVRTDRTSEQTLGAAVALSKRLRKTGVVAGVCFGFIGNRMLNAYRTEALRIALEGSSVAEIDRALKGFGMPMGPFALMDLTGLDVNVKMRSQAAEGLIEKPAFAIVDRLYEAGRRGQRFGGGFYDYADGSRDPVAYPDIDRWIAEEAQKLRLARPGPISGDAIVDRCMLTLANEGARILEEGVAIRSGDIDVTYIAGYGFPRHIGGPMFWAEQQGLAEVLKRLNQHHDQFRLPRWKPSALIERAAAVGVSLNAALPGNRKT